jgi:PmbA protein
MLSRQTQATDDTVLDPTYLSNLVSDALAEAATKGATSAEVAISSGVGLYVTVRMGDVETVEHVRDKGLSVTVYVGQRMGAASTTDFRGRAVQDTVDAAIRVARYTEEDDCAGLADAKLMAESIPSLDLYHPWTLEPEQGIELAQVCEQAARSKDAKITNSEGATVARHASHRVYGNTHGFLGSYSQTRHSIRCAVIAEDASGMQRDYWYTVARAPLELEAPEEVGTRAAERALKRLSPQRLTTRQAPIVFAAEIAPTLFSHFVNAISGTSLYRKSSFLLDQLGQPVFPNFVHIHEQPHLKRGVGSAPFDNEGVATRPRDLIAQGILQGYVLSSYAARKLGMQTTGNAGGVHNLTVDPGAKDLPGLLREMHTGLLVTELMGMGVNPVTGNYSRGAAGFWVSEGEIQFPVHEITIAGNLRDMFRDIREIGTDIETRRNIRTGSVLIEQMTIAGS